MRTLLESIARAFCPSQQEVVNAPDVFDALLRSASEFHRLGELENARERCDRALKLVPRSDIAHNLLGMVLCSQGHLADGERSFRQAIEIDAANAFAWNNLANVRKDQGDLRSAEALYQHTLKLQPRFAAAINNLGLLYLESGRFGEATDAFKRAIAVDPRDADAHNNLGTTLRRAGVSQGAEAEFRLALATAPQHVEALCGLGDVLISRGALEEAETCCRRAVELRPNDPDVLNNLASLEKARNRLPIAEALCQKALKIDPNHVATLNNLGSLAVRRADFAAAERIYHHAYAIDPKQPVTRFNLATALLTLGDYERGFAFYESRFDAFGHRYRNDAKLNERLCSLPQWQGEPLGSSPLLLWTEQGLGDTLMALRYLPELRAANVERVVVLCQPQVARIVEQFECVERVIVDDGEAASADFVVHSPMMSLPWALGTTAERMPGRQRYLAVPSAVQAVWNGRMKTSGLRIGLVWAGSATLRDDALRSIPLARFASILSMPGIEWVSLQKGPQAVEWGGFMQSGSEFIERCDDLMDTAGLISQLDLVISVDTAVAHLAGALGKPVWLLNRFSPDWRWGLNTESCRWYDSVRVVRELHEDGWEDAISEVGHALYNFAMRSNWDN